MTNHDWRLRATCRGLHPNTFHGERGDSRAYRNATKICNGDPEEGTRPCPVLSDCLDWILTDYSGDNDSYGIYAGTTPNQRSMIRRGKMERPDIERDVEREPDPTPVTLRVMPAAEPVEPVVPYITKVLPIDPARWVSEYRNGLLDKLTREQTSR